VPAPPAGLVYAEVATGSFTVARRSDGSVTAWGENFFGQCDVPALPPGLAYVQIATAADHTIARRSDGSVVAWGETGMGACDVPSLPPGFAYVGIGAGSLDTIAWRAAEIATSFCSADACPCGNAGAPGHGCANSSGQSARLMATGTIDPDTVGFTATGAMPGALTILLQGTARTAPATYGDGLSCVGGTVIHLYTKRASGGTVSAPVQGDLSVKARSAQLGDTIPPGGVRHYMTYYRDASPGFCPSPTGSTFNSSNALTIVW
jgi:hypothetical protein